PPPSNIPPPTEPVCSTPQTSPTDPVCPNTHPTTPTNGVCPNTHPSDPVPGVCPNPNLTYGPTSGVCPNAFPTNPTPAVCPASGPTPPEVTPAPVCQVVGTTTTVPPGGSNTICRQGGILYKEVPTTVTACGDSLPGQEGTCGGGVTHIS